MSFTSITGATAASMTLPLAGSAVKATSNIFILGHKKEELSAARAALKAIKSSLIHERLKEFLTLLQTSTASKQEVLKAFYGIDHEKAQHKVRDFLSFCVWIAEGRPLGDPCFGENAIRNNPWILLNIRNENGNNLVQQLIFYFELKAEKEQMERDLQQFQALLKDPQADLLKMRAAFKQLPEKWQQELIARVEKKLLPNTNPAQYKALEIGLCEIELNPRILLEHVEGFIASQQPISIQTAIDRLHTPTMHKAPINTTHMDRLMHMIPPAETAKPYNLILVGAESTHLLKQGGLAEAIFGMAEGFSMLSPKNKIRVILPLYDLFPKEIQAKLKAKPEYAFSDKAQGKVNQVFKVKIGAIKFYFIQDTPKPATAATAAATAATSVATYDHFKIGFDKAGKAQSIYGPDDATVKERFAYFAHCATELVFNLCNHKSSKKKPIDAVHLHDWHSAGVALLLSQRYPDQWRKGLIPPLVFTFHNNNGGAQGIYGRETIPTLHQLGIKRELNMLTEALRIADHVTTVSHTFSLEAQTETLGAGIAPHMQMAALRGKLTGILNGGNPNVWNCQTDAQLKQWKDPLTGEAMDLTYGPDDDIVAKKQIIREQLQKWLALHKHTVMLDFSKPILLYVGRYDSYQKGLSMLPAAIHAALKKGAQCICMGSQEDDKATIILDAMQKSVNDTQGNSRGVWIIRDTKGSDGRLIYQQGSVDGPPGIGALVRAAADFVLIPSEFEPSGLVQFEAWLFGCLAICTRTGGLADSVHTQGSRFNGFLIDRHEHFHSEAQAKETGLVVDKAFAYWGTLSKDARNALMKRVILQGRQTNWLEAAKQYLYVFAAAKRSLQARQFLYLNTGLSCK